MHQPQHRSSVKRRLVGGLLLLWLMPAIQAGLNMKIFRPSLEGVEAPVAKPVFGLDSLRDNAFQAALEAYATRNLGLREWLLRPRNQLAFSLFREPLNRSVVLGRQGQLFEREPLLAAMGRGRMPSEAEVAARVQRLRAAQDTLARRGKLLVFVVAPSKADFCPELWPDSCRSQWAGPTAYDRYRGPMRAAGLNVLDLAAVFRAWKADSPYPLFPAGGIHWSGYGLTRAADTLRRYLNAHGRYRLPAVRQAGLAVGGPPRYSDDDLTRLLNLLYDPAPRPPLAYPELAFAPPLPQRPRTLLVADSFGWGLVEFYPYFDHWFAPGSHYWYYNHEVVWPKVDDAVPGPTAVAERDPRAELAAHDVVLLLFSQQNLAEFDHGFADVVARAYGAAH